MEISEQKANLSEKLRLHYDFWQQDFPQIIDLHTANDPSNRMAFADFESFLARKTSKFALNLDFSVVNLVLSKLTYIAKLTNKNSIPMKNSIIFPIRFCVLPNSILQIFPLKLDLRIVFDPFATYKLSNINSQLIFHPDKSLFPEIWGSNFSNVERGIMWKQKPYGRIYITKYDAKTQSESYSPAVASNDTYDLFLIIRILRRLREFEYLKKNVSRRKLESLKLTFYDHFLQLSPIFRFESKLPWGIFITRLTTNGL